MGTLSSTEVSATTATAGCSCAVRPSAAPCRTATTAASGACLETDGAWAECNWAIIVLEVMLLLVVVVIAVMAAYTTRRPYA